MFDFQKEVTLSKALGGFFEGLEDRLSSYSGYGISYWYSDIAWALRLFVQAGAPLFAGKNEETWLAVADELEGRAAYHKPNAKFYVAWETGIDDDITWRQSGKNLILALELADQVIQVVSHEDADWSGPLPSGERGVTVGEALKAIRLFTQDFWAEEYKWSRTPSPHKPWLVACRQELLAAQVALGEPQFDPPANPTVPGTIPWSMPGQ